jgi:hypothetical protein
MHFEDFLGNASAALPNPTVHFGGHRLAGVNAICDDLGVGQHVGRDSMVGSFCIHAFIVSIGWSLSISRQKGTGCRIILTKVVSWRLSVIHSLEKHPP